MKRTIAIMTGLLWSVSASAQPARPVTVRVGEIASAQECTVYEGVKASSRTSVRASAGGYANAYGAGGHASYSGSNVSTFETFFVKDCTSHFEGIRSAMQSALASSGSVVVAPGGYVLTGRVEDVVPISGGFAEQGIRGDGYGMVTKGLKVTMSIQVADKAGRIVFGAPIVTEIETDSAGVVRNSAVASTSSGEGLYGLLQRQVALAASRKIAFHFRPLQVVQGGGRQIQLNYGGPLLEVGSLVSVTSADGSSAARYRITSTSEGSALAQQLGDADSRDIVPGARASVIEKGDPAANQSVLERVELP